MTPNIFLEIITLFISYLLGSIPFGLLVSRYYKLPDPRQTGSHTIGATNILRLGNKGAAFLTLFLDALKGSIAVIFSLIFAPSLALFAGILAIVGHIWPIWLKFQGGKGVSTAFGVILILNWPLAISCLMTWVMVATITRYSSLASLVTMLLSPLYAVFLTDTELVIPCLTIALLLILTHRENIARLASGKEPVIGDINTANPS
ncbi:MAG: glycerol-3-phosphate 1-O-acyltransferase PlsY [Alphaproteobacteria bacterium]|jgi:glycerol-3-phosphate acyltransferase PlsY|nr:glycerol-3-phosphate 1-O-acyltransferase PlsY [Alphaproteobacteria bacterium]MBP9776982.1 glycerol-3-phosphate 1-O-acyltransferase PlsY [Alphaproteobacteria bacterium]